MIDLVFPRTRRAVRILVSLFLFAFALLPAKAAAPIITEQPRSNIVTTNEDVAFTVTATGDAPLQYQWLFNGNALASATNSLLLLTNVDISLAGTYTVTVSNPSGSIGSSNAFLVVATNAVHRLGTGRILQIGSTAGVPISFRSNGRESSVSFSLTYDTNVLANPSFTPSDTNTVATTDLSQPGAVGVALTLPGGAMFPIGYDTVGLVKFDVVAGKNPLAASLAFTNTPTPLAVVNTNAQPLLMVASVLPQFSVVTAMPALHPQSGLFEQQLIISNPSSTVMSNVNILPLNLGVDSRTNPITFFNAQVAEAVNPYFDPLVQIDCNCACGLVAGAATDACTFDQYLACQNSNCAADYFSTNMTFFYAQLANLLPGELRTVTLEYYVTDHTTVPAPSYSVYLADPVLMVAPPTLINTFAIDTTRYLSNAAIVEFSTRLGNQYFIQWSDTAEGLSTGKIVFPQIFGTGSRVQWIDNGPPKTDTPPTNGQRFYRVQSDQR
jgi:hypothetical protein